MIDRRVGFCFVCPFAELKRLRPLFTRIMYNELVGFCYHCFIEYNLSPCFSLPPKGPGELSPPLMRKISARIYNNITWHMPVMSYYIYTGVVSVFTVHGSCTLVWRWYMYYWGFHSPIIDEFHLLGKSFPYIYVCILYCATPKLFLFVMS